MFVKILKILLQAFNIFYFNIYKVLIYTWDTFARLILKVIINNIKMLLEAYLLNYKHFKFTLNGARQSDLLYSLRLTSIANII